MRVWAMRKEIVVNVTAADCARLRAVVANRNSPQNRRAEIILRTPEMLGTDAVMRGTGRLRSGRPAHRAKMKMSC